MDGRTVWADWRSAQRTIGALSEVGLACLIDLHEPTSWQWWEVGSQWPEMAAAEFL